jgi:hypothetical protein
MIAYISIGFAMILATTGLVFVLDHISNKHVAFGTKIMILFFWMVSFLPFFLVPLDFSFYNYPDKDKELLDVFWKLYYFMNLFNGQILLPLAIAYVGSGHVNKCGRVFWSVWEVIFWILIKLGSLIVAIIVGFWIAINVFEVKEAFVKFFFDNIIGWMNTA